MIRAITRQTEPEWDADSRALAEGLAEYDAGVCAGCGIHKWYRDHPDDHVFGLEQDTCPICAYVERQGRRTAAQDHDWDRIHKAPEPDAPLPQQMKHAGKSRPGDGRHVYLKHMTPEQVLLAQKQGDRPKEG